MIAWNSSSTDFKLPDKAPFPAPITRPDPPPRIIPCAALEPTSSISDWFSSTYILLARFCENWPDAPCMPSSGASASVPFVPSLITLPKNDCSNLEPRVNKSPSNLAAPVIFDAKPPDIPDKNATAS